MAARDDELNKYWDAIWDLTSKYDIPVTNNIPAGGMRTISEFGRDVFEVVRLIHPDLKAPWE